ncbi:MAG: TetR/AcrR family transcriptional regulator [Nitrospinales bacterium]
MKTLERTTEAIRSRILDAAFARFGKYGMGKTTMAEIAADCDMSAGNLYRYYENKAEIAAECAARCLDQTENLLRNVLRKQKLSPGKRLEQFVLQILHHKYEQFSDQPRIFELLAFISEKRWDLVSRSLEVQRSLMAEILAEGNRSGEFDIPDILSTARMIQAATVKFNAPHFMNIFSLRELEQEARGVVRLLIRGLAKVDGRKRGR